MSAVVWYAQAPEEAHKGQAGDMDIGPLRRACLHLQLTIA